MQKLLIIISAINCKFLLILIKIFLLTHPTWYRYFQLFVFLVVVTLSDQWHVFQDGPSPWRSDLLQLCIASLEMSTKIMGFLQGHMQIYYYQYSLFQFNSDQGKRCEGLYGGWFPLLTFVISMAAQCKDHLSSPLFYLGWPCSRPAP